MTRWASQKKPRQRNEAYYTPSYGVAPLTSYLRRHLRFRDHFEMWEPAAGAGHVAQCFTAFPFQWRVTATDIAPARVQVYPVTTLDFFTSTGPSGRDQLAIITNPPYGEQNRMAVRFAQRSLELAGHRHGLVALLLPFEFDSAASRDRLVGAHPAFAAKITCARRLRWVNVPQAKASPMSNHAWFIWCFDEPLRQRMRQDPMRTL